MVTGWRSYVSGSGLDGFETAEPHRQPWPFQAWRTCLQRPQQLISKRPNIMSCQRLQAELDKQEELDSTEPAVTQNALGSITSPGNTPLAERTLPVPGDRFNCAARIPRCRGLPFFVSCHEGKQKLSGARPRGGGWECSEPASRVVGPEPTLSMQLL